MALTKVTGQVINTSTDVTVGVLTVTNTLSVGGTLTYEDVTNVDSVGLITARSGVSVTGGEIKVGSGITLSPDGDVFAVGVSTFNSNVLVGSGITLSPDGDGFFSGITTAKSASCGGGVLQESFHNHTSAVSGNYYHDVLTHGMVYHGATNAGSNYTFGIRGDANTTFDLSLIHI